MPSRKSPRPEPAGPSQGRRPERKVRRFAGEQQAFSWLAPGLLAGVDEAGRGPLVGVAVKLMMRTAGKTVTVASAVTVPAALRAVSV